MLPLLTTTDKPNLTTILRSTTVLLALAGVSKHAVWRLHLNLVGKEVGTVCFVPSPCNQSVKPDGSTMPDRSGGRGKGKLAGAQKSDLAAGRLPGLAGRALGLGIHHGASLERTPGGRSAPSWSNLGCGACIAGPVLRGLGCLVCAAGIVRDFPSDHWRRPLMDEFAGRRRSGPLEQRRQAGND